MLRLDIRTEPYWLPLDGFEARFLVRPISTALVAGARQVASASLLELSDHANAIREAGGDVIGLPDLDNSSVRLGISHEAFVKALASAAIIAWEGVAGIDGNPAPVTRQTVGDLMGIYPIGDRWLSAYLSPLDLLDAEKNGSKPAPDGTTVAALNIAAGAESKDCPAPAAGGA